MHANITLLYSDESPSIKSIIHIDVYVMTDHESKHRIFDFYEHSQYKKNAAFLIYPYVPTE